MLRSPARRVRSRWPRPRRSSPRAARLTSSWRRSTRARSSRRSRRWSAILELGLQTGRIRALYGPGGEQAALRLYRKLPHGTEAAATVEAVNEALHALSGRELESVQLRAVGPGAFSLTIQADGAEVGVHLDRNGARVAGVGV